MADEAKENGADAGRGSSGLLPNAMAIPAFHGVAVGEGHLGNVHQRRVGNIHKVAAQCWAPYMALSG